MSGLHLLSTAPQQAATYGQPHTRDPRNPTQIFARACRVQLHPTPGRSPGPDPMSPAQAMAREFAREEQEHVAFMRTFLGAGAPAMPPVSCGHVDPHIFRPPHSRPGLRRVLPSRSTHPG